MIWEKLLPPLPFKEAKTWKIVASAGCGKTHILERTILELLESGTRPNEIMYLIFNRKPAEEFRTKLNERGIADQDMPWINTHHSVCLRILGLYGKNVLDLKKWGKEHNMDFDEDKKSKFGWAEIKMSLDMKLYEGDTDYDPEEMMLLNMLTKEENENKLWTHSRYMSHALLLKRIPPSVKYVFIDEAQDSVKIQWDYYEYLKANEQVEGLMIAGDDKQAINNWKGSRGDLFLAFEADRNVCLDKTWRNAAPILSFANSVVEYIKDRSPLTIESEQIEKGSVLYIDRFSDVIYDISIDITLGNQIMVLCRNGVWAQEVRTILWKNAIPVQSEKHSKILEMLKAFRDASENQTYENIVRLFSCDVLRMKDYWTNFELFRKGNFTDTAKAEFELMSAGMEWSNDWSLFGAKPLLATNFDEIRSNNWSGISCKKDYSDSVKDVLQSIKEYGWEYKPVIVSVIHRVKGMECDTVILVRNITGAVHRGETFTEDDERRVWYTAITRARTKVIITELWKDYKMNTQLI
jgi:superfamily I DNA/RNA helicase